MTVELMIDRYLGISIIMPENQRLFDKETPLTPIMQWVAVSKDEEGDLKYHHQFDEDDLDTETQHNIKEVYTLQKERKLIAMFMIPKNMRLDPNDLDPITPRMWVSMLDGTMHINGVEYDPRSEVLKYLDPQPEYQFEWWVITREAHGPEGYPRHIRRYELGWHCFYKEEKIERIIFYDVIENVVYFSTKR